MKKETIKLIIVIAIVSLLSMALVSAAKVTLTTQDGPVTIEGSENVIVKFLKSLFGSGSSITGHAVADVACDINVPGDYATIQAAVNAATEHQTICVAAGTYNENVKITKHLTLTGAGATTIIQPPLLTVGSLGVAGIRIMLAGCGPSADDHTIIKNLRVTGGYNGVDTENFPDSYSRTLTFSHITLENLQVDNSIIHSVDAYTGSGINVRKWANYNDIIMNNIIATDNAKFGIDFNAQLNSVKDLTVNGGYFENNRIAGLEVTTVNANNIIIRGATFKSNGLGGFDVEGDIVLSGPNGNIEITDVTINSGGASTGIRLSGPGTLAPSGTITLTNVIINGIQKQWPRQNPSDGYAAYPSGAIVMSRYSDVSKVSFNNVKLQSTAPVGLFLGTIYNTPAPALDITGITFNGKYDQVITLGRHGNSLSYAKANVNVDARNAIFANIPCPQMESYVWHQIDDPALGLVLLPPCCTDNDNDGYAVEGGTCGAIDCNDNNANVNPGVLYDTPGNNIDENCDKIIICPVPCEEDTTTKRVECGTKSGGWRNHGMYVSCVSEYADGLFNSGVITQSIADAMVESAAQSTIGS